MLGRITRKRVRSKASSDMDVKSLCGVLDATYADAGTRDLWRILGCFLL